MQFLNHLSVASKTAVHCATHPICRGLSAVVRAPRVGEKESLMQNALNWCV